MLALTGCCTNTTSNTAQTTSDSCYNYCNLTSSDEAIEIGGCLKSALDAKGVVLGDFDVGFLGDFGMGASITTDAGGEEASSTDGGLFTQAAQTISLTLTSSSTLFTGATVTPARTTTKYAGGPSATTMPSASRKSSSGHSRKVEWRVGLLVVLAVLGKFT